MLSTCTILFCNQHQKTNINQKQILYLPSTTIISYHLADFAPPRLIAFPTFPHALNSRSSLLSHPQTTMFPPFDYFTYRRVR